MKYFSRAPLLRLNIFPFLGVLFLVCALLVSPSRAQTPSYEEDFSEDLVLAVFTDSQRLSAGIFAVQQQGRYYLPIGALSDIFGFYIEMDLDARQADGWAMSEDDDFFIDAATHQLSYNGDNMSLPSEAFLNSDMADDDIYIALEVFNQIWPITLDVNLTSLILRVIPDDKLPFQAMLERKERQKNLLLRKDLKDQQDETELPFLAYPYQLIDKPSIDLSASAGYDAQADSPVYRTSLNGVQDLGFASADYSVNYAQVNGKSVKPENLRLRFRRQNIYPGALPFGLEDTRWGDVRLQNRELIVSGSTGRGFTFSTQAGNSGSEFDLITVEGVATPGWEVELYINNELIDFSAVQDDGIYRFEDVSVGYGNNRIRTVLYGPQGQTREKTENFFYRSNMVKAGENAFSGGVVDENNDLITIDERESSRNRVTGLAANVYGARGISDKLTVFGSASTVKQNIDNDDVSQEYVTAGAVTSFKNSLLQAELYKQLDQGYAADLRTISDFKGFKINTQTSYFNDFSSPDARSGENAKKFAFDFDVRKIFPTVIGSLGLEAGADYLRLENKIDRINLNTRQSLGVKATRFTHATRTVLSEGDHASTTGRFLSSTRRNKWVFRNALNYRMFPEFEANSFQTELRYGTNKTYSYGVSALRSFDTQETQLNAQITKDFKKFLGSAQAGWSSDHGVSFLLRASASLGPYAPDGSYIMQSDPLRNAGPVSAFIYQDKDYDGVYSEGDEPIEDAKIAVGRRVIKKETDEDGYMSEMNSYVNGRVNVSLNADSIDDPYLIPANEGFSLYPRPGVMHTLELPVIETGAIDGTLRWDTGRPIAGLLLELMDGDAKIVQRSKTATDGYFTFERVPPGDYTIRASPETGMNIPFKQVNLTPDNLFQFGTDITAVDLNKTEDVDLDFGINDDGAMQVKNIISLAKGAKSKRVKPKSGFIKANATALTATGATSSSAKTVGAGGKNLTSPSDVTGVRIGNHPDKIRVVLDLTKKTSYTLDYDPKGNHIFVELPYASWSALKNWSGSSSSIINNYTIEQAGSGVRMIMAVADGAKVGASGLLNADKGKKDRLYIDVERK